MASCQSVLVRFLGWDGEAFILAISWTCGKPEKVNPSPSAAVPLVLGVADPSASRHNALVCRGAATIGAMLGFALMMTLDVALG
jgi:hypothetical protein